MPRRFWGSFAPPWRRAATCAAPWWAETFFIPGSEDPLAVADAAGGIIHDGWTVEEAIHSCEANRGRDMDRIARHF